MHNKSNLKIKVLGVGGCGNNSIKALMNKQIPNVEYIAFNTDSQALTQFDSEYSVPLGDFEKRRGFGAGNDPQKGRECALESKDEIENRIKDADIVIIAAGMGKGTGTGASPVIAEIAKKTALLTIAVVTIPFAYEGEKIFNNAKMGLELLKKEVDAILIVSNDKLLESFGALASEHSLKYSNTTLEKTIEMISEITNKVGTQNVDFADLLSILKNKGEIIINSADGSGKDRAQKAVEKVLFSPILESSIIGATDVIVNITGSNVTYYEISLIIDTIKKATGINSNIIQGLINTETQDKDIKISIVASGIDKDKKTLEKEEIQQINFHKENNKWDELFYQEDFPGEENLENEEDESFDDLPSFLK
ncbi:cell division protein FtsZ [Mesomycoplasma lagogenitalium]|uniref:Cell division protein FtsZ n=1 Tax=Mesomycoplasma lagogenitalium TaxID=171286 RepID=A0ABY8LSL6_9BACT|nr:cell division protein FtsZ [Mesomycoplasma lagogenitalium]WGI36257.1 cell division protein FtsZ [Mesomycoplasma lagogenitalium]